MCSFSHRWWNMNLIWVLWWNMNMIWVSLSMQSFRVSPQNDVFFFWKHDYSPQDFWSLATQTTASCGTPTTFPASTSANFPATSQKRRTKKRSYSCHGFPATKLHMIFDVINQKRCTVLNQSQLNCCGGAAVKL